MAPLTEIEVKKTLLGCTARKAKTYTYTDLLGFRQLSLSKTRAGPQNYEGVAGTFYTATTALVHALSAEYRSSTQIHDAISIQPEFNHEAIEECLTKYGQQVWNDGHTTAFVTRRDTGDENDASYPDYLVYNVAEDLTKIRTYVYCLILQRTCRTLRQINETFAMESPHEQASRLRDDQTFVLPPDPDVIAATAASNVISNLTLPPGSEHTSSETSYLYRIPVVQMVSSCDHTNSMRPQSTAAQLNVEDTGTPGPTNSTLTLVEHQCEEDELDERSTYRPDAFLDASVDMVATHGESADRRVSPRKRKRSARGDPSNSNFRKLQTVGRTRGAVRLKRKGSLGGISRPSITVSPSADADGLDREEFKDNRNGRGTCSTANGRLSTVAAFHGLPMAWDEPVSNTSIDPSAARNFDENMPGSTQNAASEDRDIDSVQGSRRTSPVVEEPRPSIQDEENPSLIVKLKLNHAARHAAARRRLDRKRLALKLPLAFEPNHAKSGLLKETIKLVASLRGTDKLRLEDSFGDYQAPYQMIIDQWLEFVTIYLQFREKADFHDDRNAWDTYMNSFGSRFAKHNTWGEASVRLEEWRLAHPKTVMYEWSRDVTCVLIEMAEWGGSLKTGDVEELKKRVLEFNHSVLVWFN